MTPKLFLLLAITTLLLLSSPTPASSSTTSSTPTCLTPTQITCLLDTETCTTDNDGANLAADLLDAYPNATQQILLGRLRFPGTASTHDAEMFKTYEIDRSRYGGLGVLKNGCGKDEEGGTRLCFDADQSNSNGDAVGGSGGGGTSFALEHFHQSGWGSHSAYDVVSHSLTSVLAMHSSDGDQHQLHLHPEPFLTTTLREFGSYSHKWYAFRTTWDRVVDLKNATYMEWIDLAPWRNNVVTRMLGSSSDRRVMPKNLLYTRPGENGEGGLLGSKDHADAMGVFLKDEYMKGQNDLGPKESEVYQRALSRLEQMVHFGIFHRLTESWQLMAHTFCWDLGYQPYRPDKEVTGFGSVKSYVIKGGGSEDEAARIWKRLKETNRLDMALMEEAEKIFEVRLAKMKREKDNGVLCNFMGRVRVTCASAGGNAASGKKLLR